MGTWSLTKSRHGWHVDDMRMSCQWCVDDIKMWNLLRLECGRHMSCTCRPHPWRTTWSTPMADDVIRTSSAQHTALQNAYFLVISLTVSNHATSFGTSRLEGVHLFQNLKPSSHMLVPVAVSWPVSIGTAPSTWSTMQGLFVPFALVGISDPVRVLRPFHNNYAGYSWSIYCQ